MSGEMFVGLIISALAFLTAGLAVIANMVFKTRIEVLAMKESTHSIQYVPVDKTAAFEELGEDQKKKLNASMGGDLFEENLN